MSEGYTDNIKHFKDILPLSNPEPYLLEKVTWNILRPNLAVNSVLARPDISLSRTNELWSFDKLPSEVQNKKDGNVDIGNEKAWNIKSANKDVEAIENDDDGEVNKGKPSSIWLEMSLEYKSVTVNVLSKQSCAEA